MLIGSGRPVSSTNKTDRHDITEILLKVALNIIKPTKPTDYNKNQQIQFNSIQFNILIEIAHVTYSILA
jgi:hypothetical protein